MQLLREFLLDMEQNDEVINIGKALVESTKNDDLRFDAHRIMAMAYKAKGEYQAVRDSIEKIPEIYFTKLEVAAKLLEGEVFKGEEDMLIWISDDENRLPVYFEAPLLVGAAAGRMSGYDGLKYPFTSLIKKKR